MKLILNSIVFFMIGFITCGSNAAQAEQAKVVGVQPVYRFITRYEVQDVEEIVCYDNAGSNDGFIEQGTDGLFGSTEGAIGAVVGGAIGRQIGGGRGRDAATILGIIVGNRIGNNANRRREGQICETRIKQASTPVRAREIASYRVQVEVEGEVYTVNRDTDYAVGSYIPVNVSVR